MLDLLIWIVLGTIALWIFVLLPLMKKDLRENEAKKQTALTNQEALCSGFFDGSKSKIWKATDNYLPAENMIAGAIEHGYSVASRDGEGLSTTIVFVKD